MNKSKIIILGVALAFFSFALGYAFRAQEAPGFTKPSATSVDVTFLQQMTQHHQQAVSMSLTILKNGSDPGIKNQAIDIILGQTYEVGLMEDRLGAWGYEAQSVSQATENMHGDQSHSQMGSEHLMPGMASQEDLERLESSQGTEADLLFLQLMKRHHEGGIQMATQASTEAKTAVVRSWAESMQHNQSDEINEMDAIEKRLS